MIRICENEYVDVVHCSFLAARKEEHANICIGRDITAHSGAQQVKQRQRICGDERRSFAGDICVRSEVRNLEIRQCSDAVNIAFERVAGDIEVGEVFKCAKEAHIAGNAVVAQIDEDQIRERSRNGIRERRCDFPTDWSIEAERIELDANDCGVLLPAVHARPVGADIAPGSPRNERIRVAKRLLEL